MSRWDKAEMVAALVIFLAAAAVLLIGLEERLNVLRFN